MNTQMLRKRVREKATQHNTRPVTTFPKNTAALRWNSNLHLMHSRRDALPTELLRQLSWLGSKSPIQTKAKQSEHKQVNSNFVMKIDSHYRRQLFECVPIYSGHLWAMKKWTLQGGGLMMEVGMNGAKHYLGSQRWPL